MRAKINIRLEIIDGEDAGYILEESNKIIDLRKSNFGFGIEPYRVTLEFVTPNLLRERRALEESEEDENGC